MRATGGAVAVLLLLPLASCSSGYSRVETRPLSAKNPTTFDFDVPAAVLHDRLVEGLGYDSQFRTPVFGATVTLHVSDAASPVFGTDLLAVQENKLDLYLQAFHEPLWASPVYRGEDGVAFPFLAEFHVHLSALNPNRTRVSVSARRTEIINGRSFGLGHNGPGWFTRYVTVEPTSIEEYVVLRYLGRILGTKGMPDVIMPAARQGHASAG